MAFIWVGAKDGEIFLKSCTERVQISENSLFAIARHILHSNVDIIDADEGL